ncbi:hypothetical protein L6452_01786 [Arctium lappa]|uniref:Uncharacterized protein n=1 Tax=Arctium lappa TaxID=4217 RepID=A0ACB9FIF8_ARCLA|nr:hypothetical protein L6452_01786 [Arctium lappa]
MGMVAMGMVTERKGRDEGEPTGRLLPEFILSPPHPPLLSPRFSDDFCSFISNHGVGTKIHTLLEIFFHRRMFD